MEEITRGPAWLLGWLVFASQLPAQLPEQSPRVVDYSIQVRLGGVEAEAGRTLICRQEVTWKNPAAASTSELFWHVYNNAWATRDSVWLTESRELGNESLPRAWGRTVFRDEETDPEREEYVELLELNGVPFEEPPLCAVEWIAQEGGKADKTVMRTALGYPVPPGGSVKIGFDFTAVLPPAFRRSGAGGEGYLHAVQWFPKLGVFEERDGEIGWNCLPYHYLTEFYADYGSYQVDLTLPDIYLGSGEPCGHCGQLLHPVGASGSLLAPPENHGDGTATWRFRAEDVHDFAWTVDPTFLVEHRVFRAEEAPWTRPAEETKVAAALGRSVEDTRPSKEVEMILLLQPEHEEYRDEYFDALGNSLYWFGLWYGEYPYPTITCVDPANDARRTGGMEYPRLFTGGVRKGNHPRTLSPEGITVHEFGHQFWYGLVGNDEFHHAWIDEGFTTYSTARVMEASWEPALSTTSVLGSQYAGRSILSVPDFGEGDLRGFLTGRRWESPDLGFIGPLSFEVRRATSLERWFSVLPPASYLPAVTRGSVEGLRGALSSDWGQALAVPTWRLFEDQLRRVNAYSKPAMMLETMARLMGEERWTRLMRTWHENWRFGHPRPSDFHAHVLNHAAGSALGDVEIDWDSFWSQAFHRNETMDFAAHRLLNQSLGDESWRVRAEVRRRGSFTVPLEIEIEWEDGEIQVENWDGRDTVWIFEESSSPRKAVRLTVDPSGRLLFDKSRIDNTILIQPRDDRAQNLGIRAFIWAQSLLHFAGGMG